MAWRVKPQNIDRNDVAIHADTMNGIGISVQSITVKYMRLLCAIVG